MAWPGQAAGRGRGRLDAARDLAAVASDISARGIGTRDMIFAWGSSNGGMLVTNGGLLAPEAFGGIWADKAVLDLRDYHQRGQGAFWQEEYGDPGDTELLQSLSPICNIPASGDLPPFLFTAAANDDRVPAEDSVRMVEALTERGHEADLFFAPAGGHQGDADDPYHTAIGFAFLQSLLARLEQPG